jgi:hypothetical protein
MMMSHPSTAPPAVPVVKAREGPAPRRGGQRDDHAHGLNQSALQAQ